MLKGIDVSKHNGTIDWQKVKNSGTVDFAVIRAGYGKLISQKDVQFGRNYAECKKYNITSGENLMVSLGKIAKWYDETNGFTSSSESSTNKNLIPTYIQTPLTKNGITFTLEDDYSITSNTPCSVYVNVAGTVSYGYIWTSGKVNMVSTSNIASGQYIRVSFHFPI